MWLLAIVQQRNQFKIQFQTYHNFRKFIKFEFSIYGLRRRTQLEGTQRVGTHAVLLLTLTLSLTLTFDLKTILFIGYLKVIPLPSLNTLGQLFLNYAADKQTNRQTNKHTDPNILPTPNG